jgi:hypothetical protein
MKTLPLVALSFLFVSTSFAGLTATEEAKIRHQADAYFLMFADQASMDPEPGECKPPRSQACILFVAGSFPSSDVRIAAAKACVGNYGAECATWVAGSFSNFDTRVTAARVCRGARSVDCAQFVAGSFPSSDLRHAAAAACKDATVECVKFVAGDFASTDTRLAAAKACSDSE